MNGYFRVSPTATGTDMEIFAPTDGGAPLTIGVVTDFLNSKMISYDLASLNKAVEQSVNGDCKITLNMIPCIPLSESCFVSIDKEKMAAYMMLYPASAGGARMNADDIKGTLAQKGVIAGFLVEDILDLIENPRYCEDILVAKGEMPTESTDGYVEYLFNTDNSQKPTLLEDGSVDFFHLNVLNSCDEGQVVAKLHASKKGEDGFRIDGSVIAARAPKEVVFKYGNNIGVSEDGTELIAQTSGSVSLVGEQVFVNNSLSFDEVGTATGNIDYEGDVFVKGNVATNFAIKAKGDVVVDGVVEGAEIEAGGNIIIAKGVNGMGRAKLKAGGNIIAKYMENVEATAEGYISSEAIMHSTISANGDITVDGRKGMLSGGKATSGGCISVKTLGAEMANDTIVEVGLSPLIKKEIQTLRNEVAEKQKTIAQIQPVLQNLAVKVKSGVPLSNEQKVYVSKLMATQNATMAELETQKARLDSLESKFNVDTAAEVRVKGIAYPGSRVCISDVSMAVKSPTKYCKFVKLRGDVKITSYE